MVAWTREDILGVRDVTMKAVADVPGWNGATVWLKTMSIAERDGLILSMRNFESGQIDPNFRARLLVRTICDSEGNRLFSEEDVEALGSKSPAAISYLFAEAQKLNEVKEREVDVVEAARKNS